MPHLTRVPIGRAVAPFTLALFAIVWSSISDRARTPLRLPLAPRVSEPAVAPMPSPPALPSPVPRPPLVLDPVNGGDTVALEPLHENGGFSAGDLERAALALSQPSPGKAHPLAPRLLDLVYRSVRHFDGGVVHVVSGYRRDRAGSRHTQGRAIDMRVDGVSPRRLAAYLRTQGFVGVGLYPKAGFVHLDVREASYFWIDDSAPGAPSRLVPVLEEDARNADLAARARGEAPDVFVPNARADP